MKIKLLFTLISVLSFTKIIAKPSKNFINSTEYETNVTFSTTNTQISGSFTVQGDIDKFYPVTFFDGGWDNNAPTNLLLSRSEVHYDSTWRGSLMAEFSYHVTNWGNSSNFIDSNIKPSYAGTYTTFIAGWHDSTYGGTCRCIIIWLRGGGTTYYYHSNYTVTPTIYDGVQNSLPYNELNGPSHSYKTTPEQYATTTGIYQSRNAYFASNVGIGTTTPGSKLTVAGNIHAQEVKVTPNAGTVPDYVFADDYKLKSLEEVEAYIKQNSHLPEIPSAKEIEKNGLMLAEMNMSLLKKIEELTLYMIELKKENQNLTDNQKILEEKILKIENR
ncbi:tail fiber protein [Flavobacterium gyeonganense]|uniref:Tail fiber protein n=1 Tax=Flavobacterium gyeonganense TaxID=1310418 RepID=A0ABV5HF70_9FLAO|nr:tail fiber protein [Flavobacterium gyeonganense]